MPLFSLFREAILFAVLALEISEDTGVGDCAVRSPQMHHFVSPEKSPLGGKKHAADRQTFLADGLEKVERVLVRVCFNIAHRCLVIASWFLVSFRCLVSIPH